MTRTTLLLAALLVAACNDRDEPPVERRAPEGRAETQSIRNTDAVGYDGSATADQVDAALDANERRAQQQQEATAE